VQVGDKATLTFDALPNLTIAGTVAEVDPIGTITSGVVSYNEQITFDTEDSSIKTGMSVDASIITKVAADALTVPASAVKTSGTSSYVQVFQTLPPGVTGNTFSSSVAPINVPVTIGITDDINTQILSGLSAGQYVVTATVAGSSAKSPTSSAAPSLFSAVGAGGGARAGGGFTGGARAGGL
jgi:multidrug efflux pump subunit AcrA (membrane-fusion protein)